MSQYSYVFVNLYEQECRFGRGLNMMMGMAYAYNRQSQQSQGNGRFSMGSSRGGRRGSPTSNRGRSGSPSNRGGRKCGSPSSRLGKLKGGGGSPISSRSSNKKGAVNPRATKCHSIQTQGNNKPSLFSSAAGAAARGRLSSNLLPVQQLNKNGLGSFLNNHLNLQSSSNNDDNNNNGSSTTATTSTQQQRQRRVEEEYDLRDLLGTGTCGEVRRAIHRRTGEERAVKIISIGGRSNSAMPTGGGMSTEKLSAIQAEATILRSLDHPYVVKLFDMFIAPGKAIYLVMELIKGGDLFDRIVEKEVYTEVQARRLFRRILNAVHYLHEECGIVHRDLKPENILVVDRRNDVNIKLTDFGLG